jgi:uncharacterized protein (TIGR03437 family)
LHFKRKSHYFCAVALMLAQIGRAAEDRIAGPVDPNRTVTLPGRVHPNASPRFDRGSLDPAAPMSYLSLMLTPFASLEAFLAGQRSPQSPDFQHWLTPEQFGDRFGLSTDDLSKITAWLVSEGLTTQDVARGRHWITFSGTAAQVGRALHTEIHRYRVNGVDHFSNLTDPSIPAALASVVSGIEGLNDFDYQPAYRNSRLAPDYNSGSSHYLAPDDFANIYDVSPLYAAGIDGTGQKIAIIGRTDVDLADIRAFRERFNLSAKDPQLILYGTDPGTSATDLPEADLDLEWSGAIARNATIIYVYSRSINTSAQYAVDQNLAPVMSMSYGGCELANQLGLRYIAQQANAQGITWIASSGDDGAATCDLSSVTPQASKGLTADFPASIPEITGVGGTRFNEGNGTYWASSNTANSGSALSYIPEIVWNDSVERNQLAASGGGASVLFPKPVWQTGPGVPADNARDVPDISLAASPDHDGYLFQSSGALRVVGGTSAGAPSFAGILALLNQYLISKNLLIQPGLGNVNPTLYRLAQSTADIFHDIVTGDNRVSCEQSSPDCVNGLVGYAAAPGYDLATGLGSFDVDHLVTEWTSGPSTRTIITATPSSFALSDKLQLTATVAGSGKATPTGTVTFLSNDISLGTATLSASGVATISASGSLVGGGNGTISALYSGDAVFDASAGSVTVSLKLPASGSFVVPSITPNPVYQTVLSWPYTVALREKAGVATTLTAFTINGTNQNLNNFTSVNIPANGTVTASLSGSGLTPPLNRTFVFTGSDAGGKTWTQQLTVPFLPPAGPPYVPTITLTGLPAAVQQNPQADPSCQWAQQLIVEEQTGFEVILAGLTAGGTDFSNQIQQIFGTTRIAPYGSLHGTVCWNSRTALGSKTYQITGSSELGTTVAGTATSTLVSAASQPAVLSVSPPALEILAGDASPTGTAAVELNFVGAAPAWTVTVLPANRTSTWLNVAPLSGMGAAKLTVTASAGGLSKGIYNASLVLQTTGSNPQLVTVPIAFVVGSSSTTLIDRVVNAAAPLPVLAPGAMANVFGSALSPAKASAPGTPLPLTLAGVSATVNGITAPLYSVAPGKISLQIPYETTAGVAVLGINNNGELASFLLPVAVAAPSFFTTAGDLLTPSNTGRQAEIVTAFIIGEGDVTPFLATGASPPAGTSAANLPGPRLPVTVTVAGQKAPVQFAGIAPGLVGVTQINFTIPASAPVGVQPVIVSLGGIAQGQSSILVTPAASGK